MATWEDGPEYAPIERPDQFFVPDVAPLSAAPAPLQPAAGAPVERPTFADPADPVVALADLAPAPEVARDPSVPYEVVSTALTSGDSAWSAVHWQPPTGPMPSAPAPWAGGSSELRGQGDLRGRDDFQGRGDLRGWGEPQAWGEPSGNAQWSYGPLNPSVPPAMGPTGFPAPGTTQWFGPAPYAPAPPPIQVSAKDVVTAVTPALLIVLGLGCLIHPVAPITLVVAWALSSRATVAQSQIRTAFVLAVAALAGLGLLIGFAGALDFADWWNGLSWVALVISWGMVGAVLVLASRALRAGGRPPTHPHDGPSPNRPGFWS